MHFKNKTPKMGLVSIAAVLFLIFIIETIYSISCSKCPPFFSAQITALFTVAVETSSNTAGVIDVNAATIRFLKSISLRTGVL